MENFGTTLK